MNDEDRYMSSQQVADFVANNLGLPELAEKLRDQDVDGEVLGELSISIMKEFLPSISLGTCLRFFRRLKEFAFSFNAIAHTSTMSGENSQIKQHFSSFSNNTPPSFNVNGNTCTVSPCRMLTANEWHSSSKRTTTNFSTVKAAPPPQFFVAETLPSVSFPVSTNSTSANQHLFVAKSQAPLNDFPVANSHPTMNFVPATMPPSINLTTATTTQPTDFSTATIPRATDNNTATVSQHTDISTASTLSRSDFPNAAAQQPTDLITATTPLPSHIVTATTPLPSNIMTAAVQTPWDFSPATAHTPTAFLSATTPPSSDVCFISTPRPTSYFPAITSSPSCFTPAATLPPTDVASATTLQPTDLPSAATPQRSDFSAATTQLPSDYSSAPSPPPSDVATATTLPPSDFPISKTPLCSGFSSATNTSHANITTAKTTPPSGVANATSTPCSDFATATILPPSASSSAETPPHSDFSPAPSPPLSDFATATNSPPSNFFTSETPDFSTATNTPHSDVTTAKTTPPTGVATATATKTQPFTGDATATTSPLFDFATATTQSHSDFSTTTSSPLSNSATAIQAPSHTDIATATASPSTNFATGTTPELIDFSIPTTPPPADFPIAKTPPRIMFSIESVVFHPSALQMIETGKPTTSGKSAITNAVVSTLLKLSDSKCYVSFEMKRRAATSLVITYPSLQLGMGVKSAIDFWYKLFASKLVSLRKSGLLQKPGIKAIKKRSTFKRKKSNLQNLPGAEENAARKNHIEPSEQNVPIGQQSSRSDGDELNVNILLDSDDDIGEISYYGASEAETPSSSTTNKKVASSLPSSDFSVENLVFPSHGKEMIESGSPTTKGKSAITSTVVSSLLKLSASKCYVSYKLKRRAAVVLVRTYPKLELGMDVLSAIEFWHKSFSNKLVNLRKRGLLAGPETEAMKVLYSVQAANGAKQRRKVLKTQE